MAAYTHIPRGNILDALVHIRDLHRQTKPANERELRLHERREAATRDLLSNLPRTHEHPTLKTLLEVAYTCSLTLEGAHRLFGYDLGAIREYDLQLNGGRTHTEGSHKRLSSREIHRSLCVRDGYAREWDKELSDNAQHALCLRA